MVFSTRSDERFEIPVHGRLTTMTEELDILRIIGDRLEASRVPFMLTGSFALGYYGKPRMTRDLDFVVALLDDDVGGLVKAFSPDSYIDENAAGRT